jgi:hypothetical protein
MPDLGIDKLGPFPILQIVGAIIILAGLALAVYRGTRDRRLSMDQMPIPSNTRWYFDGPLNAALETLHDQYKVLCSIDNEVEKFGEEFRIHRRLLEDIRQKLVEIKDQGGRRR